MSTEIKESESINFKGCGTMTNVIEELWKSAFVASFFRSGYLPAPTKFPHDELQHILNTSKYIDYIGGRCMKISLTSWPYLNCKFYDRDTHDGNMKSIRDKLFAFYQVDFSNCGKMIDVVIALWKMASGDKTFKESIYEKLNDFFERNDFSALLSFEDGGTIITDNNIEKIAGVPMSVELSNWPLISSDMFDKLTFSGAMISVRDSMVKK